MPTFPNLRRGGKQSSLSNHGDAPRRSSSDQGEKQQERTIVMPAVAHRRLLCAYVLHAAQTVLDREEILEDDAAAAAEDEDEESTAAPTESSSSWLGSSSPSKKQLKQQAKRAAQQAHYARLQAILARPNLQKNISNLLCLNDNDLEAQEQEKIRMSSLSWKNINMTSHDVMECGALLLANLICSVVTSTNNAATTSYDARLAHVVRLAVVQLLAECLQRQDADGRLLYERLRERQGRQALANSSVPSSRQETDNMPDDEEKQEEETKRGGDKRSLRRLFDRQKQNAADEDEKNIQSSTVSLVTQEQAASVTEKKADKTIINEGSISTDEDFETQLSHSLEQEFQNAQEVVSFEKDNGEEKATAEEDPNRYYRQYAAQKFYALEQAVAEIIMQQALAQQQQQKGSNQGNSDSNNDDNQRQPDDAPKKNRFSRKNLVRAAKIGGVGVVAASLFAVTGGMAAPALAAGLAALGVTSTTVLALAGSSTTLMALFGLGGGGLSAYKMKRRTDGLTEFTIRRAYDYTTTTMDNSEKAETDNNKAHLHTTVCISGWLQDKNDFQRPWGVTPANLDRVEVLQRFFAYFDPDLVKDVKEMLTPFAASTKDKEYQEVFWDSFCNNMREQYGKRPDEMLPMNDRAVFLSESELNSLTAMFAAVLQFRSSGATFLAKDENMANQSVEGAAPLDLPDPPTPQQNAEGAEGIDPVLRVWDYQTEFGGGDVYTLEWEGAELQKMSQVVSNMAQKFARSATQEVLKTTVLASVVTAVAFPVLLVNLANGIDNEWALVTMRSEMAGVELAKSLLQSDEERPVNLLGISFGGRVVCACLAELSQHQAIWEERQQQQQEQQEDQEAGQANSGERRRKLKWKNKGDRDGVEYKREPASIVQDVIIMGTPLFVSRSSLRACRRMVAGRFVNCYSRKDWILSLMFQYKNPNSLRKGVCGTGPITEVYHVENHDVSEIVSSWHPNYCRMVPEILDFVGWQQPMPPQPVQSDQPIENR